MKRELIIGAVVAALAVSGCGSDEEQSGGPASGNGTDRAFVAAMIPHHEGAVEMAREETDKGKDQELQALAEEIIDAQQREIDQMREHSSAGDSGHGSGHDG